MGRNTIQFTDHQVAYINTFCRTQTPKEMARALGLDPGVVYRYMQKAGICMSRSESCRIRGERRIGFTTYSAEEDQYIRDHYLTTPIKQMAIAMGRSWAGIMGRLKHMGLSIPTEVRDRNMKAGRFIPGSISYNKGKPMPSDVRDKVKATMFKPGHLPKNTLHDGAITIRTDNRGVPYEFIRIGMGKWESLARYNWRQKYGPIPHGMVIRYMDGDTLNAHPDNLKLISKRENMALNTIHNYPEEIKSVIHTLSKLNKKIRHAEE